jgi:hypothetical protein
MPRASKEAIARNRETARLRATAHRTGNRDEYNAQKRKYKANNREHVNEVKRMLYRDSTIAQEARMFIGWDGEGYTNWVGHVDGPPERKHHYMLFGCSVESGNPLVGVDLSTQSLLDYILDIERRYPDAIHVGFSFKYDVNMILGDLSTRHLRHLADYGMTHWRGYRIRYIPGKMFTVSRGNKARGEKVISATIFDIFGFFHSKYTTSLLKFGVTNEQEITRITEGKDERSKFTYSNMDYVLRYWQDEISYMPALMNLLRDACYDAGLYITRWHGPGALASYLFNKRGVKEWMSHDVPAEVQIATRYAFAGGRFQPWKCGLLHLDVYTADINSAYIYAFSLLPRLDNGRWRRVNPASIDRENLAHFGLYRISYDASPRKEKPSGLDPFTRIHPLFHRDNRGSIFWPARTEGWYWSPEARTVADNPDARFLEAWVYDDDGSRPFQWVDTEFNKRLALQHTGNPTEKTFKWALAAMYGATAQRVGWDRKRRLPPRTHELAWAGFVTSWCRAEMFTVGYECWKRNALVSIDTDGVTSTIPFDPDWVARGVGEKLGQWKLEKFSGILYWQTGIYWLKNTDGEWATYKSRGIKRGSLDVSVALDVLGKANFDRRKGRVTNPKITTTRTKFIGFKDALNRRGGMDQWRQWVDFTTESEFGKNGPNGHRVLFCRKCKNPDLDIMHDISQFCISSVLSTPHYLPWLEQQDGMSDNIIEMFDSEDDELAIFRVSDERDHL